MGRWIRINATVAQPRQVATSESSHGDRVPLDNLVQAGADRLQQVIARGQAVTTGLQVTE